MTGAELKASILQAAVQGRLVPQDSSDEPARQLLGRIREERLRLALQKKIKLPRGGDSFIERYADGTVWERRGKGPAVEITDEVPFDIPEGWEWARLESALDVRDGTHDTPKYVTQGIPLVTSKNIRMGKIDFSTCKYISEEDHRQISARSEVVYGDIIMAMIGSIGNPVLVDVSDSFSIKNVALFKAIANGCNMHYVLGFLQYAQNVMKREASGGVQSFVSLSYLRRFLVPVPPLAEQERIVAKLDEIMPLVERYDKIDRERTKLNAGIADAMRTSVLQAAVQGGLTEREAGDEPASALLERIREERLQLALQKKIKIPRGGDSVIEHYPDGTMWERRGKGPAVKITDEIPFDIPEGWEWARLGSVVNIVSARRVHKQDWRPSGIPFYRAREIVKLANGMPLTDQLFIDESLYAEFSESGVPMPGDLMVTGVGTIGTTYIVKDEDKFYYKDASVLCFENRYGMSAEYLALVMRSPMMLSQVREASSGTTVATITMKNAIRFLLPIPPLAEQERIVNKLNEVMPLVERLQFHRFGKS